LARLGLHVTLVEMRPGQTTPAHTSEWFAELVCSNSLKSKAPDSPAGLLKEEMSRLGSLVLEVAHECEVPGGSALSVDRTRFSQGVTRRLLEHPRVRLERREFTPQDAERMWGGTEPLILATGPLTTDPLARWLAEKTGRERLYFYDAVSPTVEASSVNREIAFAQSRYDKGGDDYLNCPFDRESYDKFVTELVNAERAPLHEFESGGVRTGEADGDTGMSDIQYFAGCLPIEVIAERGHRSLAHGNFKPVGLRDPRTGRRPYAVLQLRPENRERTLYSLVACQTRLRWGEQKRVFRMVPGLEGAEFVRYGVIHRNTYLDAPRVLAPNLTLRDAPNVFVAGQLTGVEGYVESAAIGIVAGVFAASTCLSKANLPPPRQTALGSLMAHLSDDTPRSFAPMNINWGLLPTPDAPAHDKGALRQAKLQAARSAMDQWVQRLRDEGLLPAPL
jgi:methylenetetrahydrofolate--tRNA-(uracil-5-)-methyltransferase